MRTDKSTPDAPGVFPDMTLDDAAAWLECHPRTIRRWISEGRLTGWRIGPRMLRVSSVEIIQLAQVVPNATSGR